MHEHRIFASSVKVFYITSDNLSTNTNKNLINISNHIKEVHEFFRSELIRHGHESRSFLFETDLNDQVVINSIVTNHPKDYYWEDGYRIGREMNIRLDRCPEEIRIFFIDFCVSRLNGFASSCFSNNNAYIFRDRNSKEIKWNKGIIKHEIGHAFGLGHDFSNGELIMSYGKNSSRPQSKISYKSSVWLNNHSSFIFIESGE